MRLDVPYHSQFSPAIPPEWQERVCSLCCLKMAFDFLIPDRAPDFSTLIKEAAVHTRSMIEHGLITEKAGSHGFVHDVIVSLAHNYGVTAYREEFKSMALDSNDQSVPSPYVADMLEQGLKKITAMLETGSLPIVSLTPGLSAGRSFHTVILIGFEDRDGTLTGFYYHDSDARMEARNNQFISLEEFITYWRKLVIFLG